MKKLSTLFAIAAMSATLGAAGCKTKTTDKESKETAAKPTETMTPAQPTPTETKPAAPKAADPLPSAAADLPAECGEYKASIEKLASCEKLPQATRDALKQSFDQAQTTWASTPADGKATLATSCKSAADAVKQAAATTCGW